MVIVTLTWCFFALILVLAPSSGLVEGRAGRADALEPAGRVPALAVPANRRVLALVNVEALPASAVGRVALVADAPAHEHKMGSDNSSAQRSFSF